MSEKQIKEYYERIEKLLNGANKETYGFAPQEIKNILRSYEELQNQNQQLKELIDTILNWDIFKNECTMNFGYDEETNENKAQDVFYKDDDYCENNCNDDYTKCWLKYFKRMHELEKGDSDEI